MKKIGILTLAAIAALSGCSRSSSSINSNMNRPSQPSQSPTPLATLVPTPSGTPLPSTSSVSDKPAAYKGSIDSLFPETIVIGGTTWRRTGIDDDIQIPCSDHARGAHYGTPPMDGTEYKKRIYIHAGDCSTTEAATAAMEKVAQQNNSTLTDRKPRGTPGGKLFVNSTGMFAAWNDGSIMVGLVSNGDTDKSDVKKVLKGLPF